MADDAGECRNSFQRACLKLSLRKSSLHVLTNREPKFITYLGMNTPVCDDLNSVVRKQDVNQYAVIALGIPDPQLGKDFNGAFTR
jgi:hypothetical protein